MESVNVLRKRYLRYIEYFVHWLVFEKPLGLDFSMRVRPAKVFGAGNHGYALTSRRALRNILRDLPIGRDDSFLDIGCGKGGVVCYASEYSFGNVSGIEVDSALVSIARKNIETLRLRGRVDVVQADAMTFDGYSEFNFFFLFNPFDSDIYSRVLNRIVSQIEKRVLGRRVWLLCYGASDDEAIRNSKVFDLYRDECCPYRGNNIHIWRSK